MDVTLETSRLRLRALSAADIPAMLTGLNDWSVVRYLTAVPYPYSPEDAASWVTSRPTPTPEMSTFAIELPDEGMVGSVGLDRELGYWLLASQHGKGLMTEACVALLDWRFDAIPERDVASGAHAGNEASLNVQRKLGFVEASRSMRFAKPHQREVEHIETVLTRDAFERSRPALGRTKWM
jgi:RimJ/RimL family protein N-acetyltransferase